MAAVSFLQRRRPRVYAHRGGCALGPENTLAAFDIALASGADGLEFDVHLAADGVPVVIHDPTLDRTTGDTGLVAARTADELARVDAGCRFTDEQGRASFQGLGIGIPTLAQVLSRYPGVPLIVEIKVDTDDGGARVAQVVAAAGASDRVCLAGFGWRGARGARRALPAAAASACHLEVRAALHRSWVGWPVGSPPYQAFQVPERAGWLRVVSRRFIRRAHRSGCVVEVWVVDEPADMERLLDWGVDGLISDRPDLAVRVRDAWVDAVTAV